MPSDDSGDSGDLYESVASTESRSLKGGVKSVDKLSAEDEEGADRWNRQAVRKAKRNIVVCTLWALFGLGLLCALAVLGGVAALSYSHIKELVDAGQSGAAVRDILGFVFGVAATLAVEFFIWISVRPKD